jgi:uncharacterized Zn-finger protein
MKPPDAGKTDAVRTDPPADRPPSRLRLSSPPLQDKPARHHGRKGTLSMPSGAPPALAPTPTEIIHVDDRVVACDGGSTALGHPRVWLRIVGTQVMCPYCSRLYVLNEGAGHDSGH